MKRSLTSKQHRVLEFIRSYFTEYRRSPLIREIQEGCDIASYKSAIDRLNALEHKGLIKRVPNKHRGIRMGRQAAAAATQALAQEPALVKEAAPSLEGVADQVAE
jgi:repressor LexA